VKNREDQGGKGEKVNGLKNQRGGVEVIQRKRKEEDFHPVWTEKPLSRRTNSKRMVKKKDAGGPQI